MSEQILATVKPYLIYATQMRDSVPIMAYHCKLYAVQKGLNMVKDLKAKQQDTDAAKSQLIGELTDLETLKKSLGTTDKDEMSAYVNNFILTVFAKTDKEEREVETITKKQALDFKRLVDFIQVLTLFGELDVDWETKRKYCVFKAGSIMQALKAGKQPDFRGNPNDPKEEEKKEVPANVEMMQQPYSP
jgi:vacuolar protein sorting-associated protein VTA1